MAEEKYLGIQQERLSLELLRELSRQSIRENQLPAPEEARIERDVVGKLRTELPAPVGFLVGESGYGKSVAAYQLLQTHVQRGGCGLFCPTKYWRVPPRLIRQLIPLCASSTLALEPAIGAKARSFGSPGTPLLIVVEDVSRSQQSAALIERLAKWATIDKVDTENSKPLWQIVCPIWPQLTQRWVMKHESELEPWVCNWVRTHGKRRAMRFCGGPRLKAAISCRSKQMKLRRRSDPIRC